MYLEQSSNDISEFNLKSEQCFWSSRSATEFIKPYKETNLPLGDMFFWHITVLWTTLFEVHWRIIAVKLIWNRASSFRDEEFQSLLYSIWGKLASSYRSCSWHMVDVTRKGALGHTKQCRPSPAATSLTWRLIRVCTVCYLRGHPILTLNENKW